MIEPATLVVYGRWWYDFLAVAWIVGFFLVEMLLLFRNSLLGWAMTIKCLTLAGVFFYALSHPAPLLPEEITIEKVLTYSILIGVLGGVILILVTMRLRRLTVVVGREGETSWS